MLQEVFGFDSFLPRQLEAISATLSGRDVIARMRTGGGKSLLYQLPSLLENRRDGSVTFVLGPLLALKNEQLQKCEHLGIPAVSIDQYTDIGTRQEILSRLDTHEPGIALFFITPQMVCSLNSRHTNALSATLICSSASPIQAFASSNFQLVRARQVEAICD